MRVADDVIVARESRELTPIKERFCTQCFGSAGRPRTAFRPCPKATRGRVALLKLRDIIHQFPFGLICLVRATTIFATNNKLAAQPT